MAKRAAKKKKKKKEKESCVRAAGLGSAMCYGGSVAVCACAVILATPVLCKEEEELHSCVEEAVAGACSCAVLCWQMIMRGNVAAGTCARASCSGRDCGGVWQYERSWPEAPS